MNERGIIRVKQANFEAHIGHNLHFWNYINSYQTAFNVLVENVETTGLPVDRFAYPMLFIVRHCLELGFKANIRYFKKYSLKTEFTNSDSHNLKDLFQGFKLHIGATISNLKSNHEIEVGPEDLREYDNYSKEVEKLTTQFDILDRGSMSFRYPVGKENDKVFGNDEKINILDIKEAFDKSMILLHHTSDVFSKYTDYTDMIEEYYEEEMRSSNGY